MNTKYTRFALAALLYMAFAVYLYRPYFRGFTSLRIQDLFVANVCIASLGCYLLSRRWIAGFAESFFAGAIYGFGPFIIGLAKFHPTAGFLVAAVPWLFCPAVFGQKIRRQTSEVRGRMSVFRFLFSVFRLPSSVFSLLPFVAIVLFFQLADSFGLYPVPINLKLRGAETAGLLAPLVAARRNMTLVGFYHIPVALLVMGLSMLLAPLEGLSRGGILQRGRFLRGMVVRRFGMIAIFTAATILGFCDSFLEVSPVAWLAVSVLCLSILIGAGMQGLISAGYADRKWILFTAIVQGITAIVTLLLATKYFQTFAGLGSGYARLLTEEAKMYILGAITVAIFFFTARAQLQIHLLKTGLLCTTMGLDIFLGARFVVDRIF